jgi:2-polyprenyl-6-methoxyphenol hydroxylase-like FAD-dependent oxidoreductase
MLAWSALSVDLTPALPLDVCKFTCSIIPSACRYRTFRDTGALLKELDVDECALGPHEIRGCIRNDLVKALADALPEGTIRFGSGVSTINMTDTGAACMQKMLCLRSRPGQELTLTAACCTYAGVDVVLENGQTYSGKAVVGADGAYSKVCVWD